MKPTSAHYLQLLELRYISKTYLNKRSNMKSFTSRSSFAFVLLVAAALFSQNVHAFTVSKSPVSQLSSTTDLSKPFSTTNRPLTRLSVTTKEPPSPPGQGKSALDLIALPLMVASAIPVMLLMLHSVEGSMTVASTVADTAGTTSNALMQTTLAQGGP